MAPVLDSSGKVQVLSQSPFHPLSWILHATSPCSCELWLWLLKRPLKNPLQLLDFLWGLLRDNEIIAIATLPHQCPLLCLLQRSLQDDLITNLLWEPKDGPRHILFYFIWIWLHCLTKLYWIHHGDSTSWTLLEYFWCHPNPLTFGSINVDPCSHSQSIYNSLCFFQRNS